MHVFIIVPGTESPCGGMEIFHVESVPICEEYSFDASLTAGDYWIWVAPQAFEGVDCGSEYYLTITCEGQNEIPTLSEWGIIALGLLLLAIGTVAVVRRRRVVSSDRPA